MRKRGRPVSHSGPVGVVGARVRQMMVRKWWMRGRKGEGWGVALKGWS